MLFRWWRNRRRQQLTARSFPPEWLQIIHQNCRHFAGLNSEEQTRLLRDVVWFLDEKSIQPAVGLDLTDEIRVTIAAHASLIGLGLQEPPFDRLSTIIVRAESYVMKATHDYGAGLQVVSNEARIGEAWRRGPVVLSWEDIEQQCRDEPDGRNVIIHEFAHVLDMENGDVDGVPLMKDSQQYGRWKEVNDAEFQRLIRETRLGHDTLIDSYGATNPIEFFAVATETFFEEPKEMSRIHPYLYDVFREFYRQDPATRATGF